ncbi:MAG: NAD(P)-dependent oxidoreductase [Myxococcales bacterium]|nr:NAD(P)-dependent oxidoreductase [Myxococcales bacterium]
MRVLVTGASGFIGLHLVRALVDGGHQVTALVRLAARVGPFARHSKVTVVEAELEDHARIAAVLPGHETCVHTALIWGEPGLEFRDVEATENLFDAAGRAGVTRCVVLSSAAVHRPFGPEMHEEDPLRPLEPYGATKAAAESALHEACARYGMTGVALRPGPVIGPRAFPGGSFRSPAQLEEVVRAAVQGRPITVVQGEGRQLSGVSSVAKAVDVLMRTSRPHPTYLCMDRDILTWEHVARVVVRELGSASTVHLVPREDGAPIPRFCTDRIENLLGGPLNSEADLVAHVRELRVD